MKHAPIHNHSEYSALDGFSTVREIVERCKCIGCEACGISDHGTVSGHYEFGQAMQDAGLKPIFACELYHGEKTTFKGQERDANHLLAGALTDEGLRNLWRMVDAASQNFRFVGRVNFDILEKFNEGVFLTSACIQGKIQQAILKEQDDPYALLNRYLNIFGDRFFMEIHTYPGEEHEYLNHQLVQIARERGVGLVYATDAHFAGPEQYELHNAYMRMKNMEHPKALYMQSEEDIRRNLAYLPKDAVDEALENSGLIADMVNAHLPDVRRHLPVFIPEKSPWCVGEAKKQTAAQLFLDLVEKGIIWRYGEDADQAIWDRAETELEVFLDAELEHYFLQAWDFVQFCDKEGIRRGPGRGSAAGSIIAYALGVTDVDPIHYGLFFERFYNAGRAEGGLPDIDNDFPVNQRKRVREYMMKRWGEDKVRAIGTITRMKPKAAIDKTYKAYDITWAEKEALKKIVDGVPDIEIITSRDIGWRRELDPGKTIYVEEHVGQEMLKWIAAQDEDRQDAILDWIELVAVVCSRVSGYGVHASGVVVSDVALPENLPSMWSASQKVQATQFPMKMIEKLKYLKQDFLGLRNLDTLEEWEAIAGEVEWSGLEKQDHPEEMWKMLEEGFTLGIFQIENGSAPRKLCKDMKPRSVEDLAAIVALNRPGPLRGGGADRFTKRRNGLEELVYDHPILEDVLDETYGIFLYQEQVMRLFEKMGLDKVRTDDVRSILGKKDTVAMEALRDGTGSWEGDGFFDLCVRNNIDRRAADSIWEKLQDFALYSFNRSHALCYGVLLLRTLYAKYHNPQAFILACIRTNPDEAGLYVGEARRMGITVSPPNIQTSQVDAEVINGDIVFGFSNIKHIGKGTAQYICYLRDHYDIELGPERLADALEQEQVEWERRKKEAQSLEVSFTEKSPRQKLRANLIPILEQAGAWDHLYDRGISLSERQEAERELLQVILTDKTEEIFAKHAHYIEACDEYMALQDEDQGRFSLPGVITKVEPKTTRKDGKNMAIVTTEYQGSQAEFAVFPQQWMKFKFMMKEREVGLFILRKTERGINLEEATKLSI